MDAFINSLLERLLATSVQTAALAALVWMLCRNVPRLSPSSQCWLWWLVALHAILGLAVSPVELPWLPPSPAIVSAIPEAMQWSVVTLDGVGALPVHHQDWGSWQATVFLLWMAGMLLTAWFTLRDWRRGNALLMTSSPGDDERMLQALAKAAAKRGLRKVPRLHVSPEIDSPMLLGHIRPVLLLPADTSLTDEELEMTLVHELAHLHRGDLWWGLLPSLARHLFFFHPLVHLAIREYGIAREAACDAAVVNSGHRSRQAYGHLLVRLGTSPDSHAGTAVASATFHCLNRRLTMLQNTTFLSRAASIVVIAIVAVTVIPLRFAAAAEPHRATTATQTRGARTLASGAQCMPPEERHFRELTQKRAEAGKIVSEVYGDLPYATELTREEFARRKAAIDTFEKLNDQWKIEQEATRHRQAAAAQAFREANPNWRQELEKQEAELKKRMAEYRQHSRDARQSAVIDPAEEAATRATQKAALEQHLARQRIACPEDPVNPFLFEQTRKLEQPNHK